MRRRGMWACAFAAALAAAGAGRTPIAAGAGQDAAPPLAIDAFVFDRQGRPVTDLGPEEFSVAMDGIVRKVVSARYVYRGPGAEAAARAASVRVSQASPMFEPWRTILVVVDELSFPRGGEKVVASATDRLLDRFGPADRVALVTVPLPADSLAVSLDGDRVAIRETLGRLTGRGAAADPLARPADVQPDVPVVDPAGAAAGSAAAGADPVVAARPVEDPRQQEALARDAVAESGDRREHPLDTIARLLAGLRVTPGAKTVVLASAGLADSDRSPLANRRAVQAALAAAVASRTTIYVLGLQVPGAQSGGWSELEELAAATGGALLRTGRNVDQALDRIGLAVSGLYHLEIDAPPTERDGRPRTVALDVTRGSLVVRCGKRLVARNDPPFQSIAAPPPPVVGARDLPDDPAPASPRAPEARRRGPVERDPELDTVVARGTEYVNAYFREFRNVVAEEDYLQTNLAARPIEWRRTKADLLLVATPDGRTLVPFRDVFEVDGAAIRDREDRLRKLFLEASPADAFEAAARVQAEGSRYNMVSPKSNVNVPTMALTFLLEPNVRSFLFRRGREDTVEGVRALRIDFEEPTRPTVIASPDGADVPSSGSLWIEPMTGRVLKTFMLATRTSGVGDQTRVTAEITVTFHRSDSLGLWVPAEMREVYRQRSVSIEGRATYSNFRSFQVRTEQEIKVVK